MLRKIMFLNDDFFVNEPVLVIAEKGINYEKGRYIVSLDFDIFAKAMDYDICDDVKFLRDYEYQVRGFKNTVPKEELEDNLIFLSVAKKELSEEKIER